MLRFFTDDVDVLRFFTDDVDGIESDFVRVRSIRVCTNRHVRDHMPTFFLYTINTINFVYNKYTNARLKMAK